MRRALFALLAASLASCQSPNATDYFIKGEAAIGALQDFNFALEYNLYQTGGAQVTIQAMKKLRSKIGYFAASGCAASYTELFDGSSVYSMLQYLSEHFQWARQAYSPKYLAALAPESQQCQANLTQAFTTIETTIQALYDYVDAKQ